jgi:hypothetical protein
LSGTASAIAPFFGGWLLHVGSWRWVFLINPPLAIVVIAIAIRHMPETRDPDAVGRLDAAGSLLGVLGLGGITAGIIAASDHVFASATVLVPLIVGVLALGAFVAVERRETNPMLPLSLFRSRQFTAANLVSLLLYAANGGALFLLVIGLQTVVNLSPLEAGTALLPITVVVLLLAKVVASASPLGTPATASVPTRPASPKPSPPGVKGSNAKSSPATYPRRTSDGRGSAPTA